MNRCLAAIALALAALLARAADEAVPPAAEAPFLWEVQGPKARHFLLGSVHTLPQSSQPLPVALDAAYAATRTLTIETDLEVLAGAELQSQILGASREDRPGGLQGRIGKALYAKLQQRAGALGMPTPVCETFRAWACALTLELYPLQQASFSPDYGIDHHYFELAREDARPVLFLETAQFQARMFVQMPDALSKQMLAATLDEASYDSQSPDGLYRMWRSGDVAAMERAVRDLKVKFPSLYARILADRTRSWVPQLMDEFKGDTPSLVVVGAAHMVGPEGLVALLKARGLEVKLVVLPIAPAEPASQPPPDASRG